MNRSQPFTWTKLWRTLGLVALLTLLGTLLSSVIAQATTPAFTWDIGKWAQDAAVLGAVVAAATEYIAGLLKIKGNVVRVLALILALLIALFLRAVNLLDTTIPGALMYGVTAAFGSGGFKDLLGSLFGKIGGGGSGSATSPDVGSLPR